MVGSALTSADFQGSDLGLPAGGLAPDALADARLLIIDDSNFALKTINAILANNGFTNIRQATDGDEGLRMAEEWTPEIIITDLYMPVKSGFDLCRDLRSSGKFQETPIIVLTSADTPALRGDVFEAGASDLITKPINARELLSRIRVHLERLRLIESLKTYQRRMAEELDSAKAMQMALLPEDGLIADLESRFPVRFAWHSQPCHDLAGDIWGLDPLDGGRVRLWCADFTGHGVRSALNTFRLNTFLRTSLKDDRRAPSAWLTTVNEFLCEVLPLGQFATMLCCDIDVGNGKIVLASAGAPLPVVRRNGVSEVVQLSGMPLGISDLASYEDLEMPFEPGSSLFAYSDALIETPSADAPLFDIGRLAGEIDALSDRPLQGRPTSLLDKLRHSAPQGLDDDLTLIFVEHTGTGAEAGTAATHSLGEADGAQVAAETVEETFEISTLEEAAELSEQLSRKFPSPETVATGVWELLANAIEHGNLEISHAEKTELLLADRFDQEIRSRQQRPDFGRRRVKVHFQKKPESICLRIEDEGKGFDFDRYLDSEACLTAPNGRGIAIARSLSFDELIYHGCGNVVEAVLRTPGQVDRQDSTGLD